MTYKMIDLLNKVKVIPIIREATFELAYQKTLLAIKNNFQVIEITFTTPDAAQLIIQIKNQYPNLIIGAGTISNLQTCKQAIKAKASFIVAPSFNSEVLTYCQSHKILYIPGALTPTEVQNIVDHRLPIVKIFPVKTLGISYVKNLKAIFPKLLIIVTGGLKVSDLATWKKAPINIFGLGSDLFSGTTKQINQKSQRVLNG